MRRDYTYIEIVADCDATCIASEELPVLGESAPAPIWDSCHLTKGETMRGWVTAAKGDHIVFLTGGSDFYRLHRGDVIIHCWGWNALLDGACSPSGKKDPTYDRLEKWFHAHKQVSSVPDEVRTPEKDNVPRTELPFEGSLGGGDDDFIKQLKAMDGERKE